MPLIDYIPLYLVSVVGSAALLTYAYTVVATATNAVLLNQRKLNSTNPKTQKDLGYSTKELDVISRDVTAHESVLYALLFNNVVYLLLFFFLAFYMLRELYTPWNYVLSQVTTAAATYYVAITMSK